MKITRALREQLEASGHLPKSRGRKKPGPKSAEQKLAAARLFTLACQSHGLPVPVPEYPFGAEVGRKWAADWCFEGFLLVEQVGGVWTGGHHSRGQSQVDDMERRNTAQILGYVVLEFTPEQITSGDAFPVIRRALGSEGEQP